MHILDIVHRGCRVMCTMIMMMMMMAIYKAEIFAFITFYFCALMFEATSRFAQPVSQ